ncbi:hypothetical protein E2C01_099562 [Portunus trituberculatus]|uniref:Uncharacterized protein n=1 Tax=Portunus trituberculatus TaxID=210409 RepID=A0A5B7KB32_PORTR|nr:hypothetical protein [Portunus trituberculatus]
MHCVWARREVLVSEWVLLHPLIPPYPLSVLLRCPKELVPAPPRPTLPRSAPRNQPSIHQDERSILWREGGKK